MAAAAMTRPTISARPSGYIAPGYVPAVPSPAAAERFAISKNLTAEGVAVPELVKKKVARNEKLIKEKKAIEKRRAERKATRAGLKQRTEKYAEEYEAESKHLIAMRRQAKMEG